MIKPKIYISGKITGRPLNQAKEKFKYTAAFLQLKGFETVSPFEINKITPDKNWNDYMVNDIKHLLECDSIYMLDDWGQSKGARIEYAIARELGLKVMFHGEFTSNEFVALKQKSNP